MRGALLFLAWHCAAAPHAGAKKKPQHNSSKKPPPAQFCPFGHRSGLLGGVRVCCPKECGACVEDDACRTAAPGALACCPVSGVLAVGKECRGRKDSACFERVAGARAASNDGVHAALARDAAQPPRGRTDLVHVAVAADSAHAIGILACAASIFSTAAAPDRIRLYIVVDDENDGGLRAALECALGSVRYAQTHFKVFQVARYMHNITIRAPRGRSHGNLRSPLNFARFYLHELLPRDVEKVVYLDSDTLAVRDVAELYDGALAANGTAALAAVSRPYQKACWAANDTHGYLYCDGPKLRAALVSRGLDDPETQLGSFNAGVSVFHLGRWREQKLTQSFEAWMRLHDSDGPLWRLGSNPPLLLTVRRDYEEIDARWNCDGLGWKRVSEIEGSCLQRGAYVWHWSGGRKPWLAGGLYKALFWQHVPDLRCLTALDRVPLPSANLPEELERKPPQGADATPAPRPPRSPRHSRPWSPPAKKNK
ncbi:nucleotide-diphospho-sugar transferase [Pelagophyceae sp. CCMP2097]|nr:nucleotide-diphospho-sugar transferase [Pelagophyceae sp. CCMP2097]